MKEANQKIVAIDTTADLSKAITTRGSMAHPYFKQLLEAPREAVASDLADIAHFFCLLHGRHPGMIDHAIGHSADPDMRAWLNIAGDAFTGERTFLTKLTVAAGPIVTTIGQDQCNNTVTGVRGSLEMLSQSDRIGCAFGASCALAIDWLNIRKILDHIALRVGMESRPTQLPNVDTTLKTIEHFAGQNLTVRAIAFGADQMLTQHRAIWDLLQARRDNRSELLL